MNSKISVLLVSVVLGQNLDSYQETCNLVEGYYGKSCLELRAQPFIENAGSEFGPHIEGGGINPKGEVFGVNYGDSSTTYQLGKFYPKQEIIYSDQDTNSLFNGIRFFDSKTAFVTDKNHRVVKLDIKGDKVTGSTFCSDPRMLEPNDVVVARTGFIFLSGQRFRNVTDNTDGELWSCTPQGDAKKLAALGRTNGIELSPEEDYLYISESYSKNNKPVKQKIWKYEVNTADGTVSDRELFVDFVKLDNSGHYDIDGMRFDSAGNLFVTRHNKGEVSIFSPDAELIGIIKLSFVRPTNLGFSGDDGKTLFIVGQCPEYDVQGIGKGCVDTIRVKTPGFSWTKFQKSYKD